MLRFRSILVLLVLLLAGATASAEPRQVRLGVFITSVSELDAADGSFRLAGYLWLVGAGDPLDPQKDIELLARQEQVTPFVATRLPDGLSYVAASFDAVVDKAFDLGDFPFDRQDLTLTIEARDSSLSLSLVPDQRDSALSQEIEIAGWDMGALQLDPAVRRYESGFGYRTAKAGFSRVAVTVEVQRSRSPLLIEKFTGFLVAFIIAAVALAVPPRELAIRGGMLTGSVFAAVLNRYRLEDAIGFDAQFGLVDQVSLITFSALIVTLALSVRSWRRDGQPSAVKLWQQDRVQEVALLAFHALLLLLAILIAMI